MENGWVDLDLCSVLLDDGTPIRVSMPFDEGEDTILRALREIEQRTGCRVFAPPEAWEAAEEDRVVATLRLFDVPGDDHREGVPAQRG